MKAILVFRVTTPLLTGNFVARARSKHKSGAIARLCVDSGLLPLRKDR
jgi:hypothetical protein